MSFERAGIETEWEREYNRHTTECHPPQTTRTQWAKAIVRVRKNPHALGEQPLLPQGLAVRVFRVFCGSNGEIQIERT